MPHLFIYERGMNMIKLHTIKYDTPNHTQEDNVEIYINEKFISFIEPEYKTMWSGTHVMLLGNAHYWVKEQPKEIVEMIEQKAKGE